VETEIISTAVRMYFVSHPDPVTGIRFPAKPRISPEAVPQLMKEYPGGYFEPGLAEGFDRYLHLVDKLNQGQKNAVDEWRRKVDERFKGQQGAQGAGQAQGKQPATTAATVAAAATAVVAK